MTINGIAADVLVSLTTFTTSTTSTAHPKQQSTGR